MPHITEVPAREDVLRAIGAGGPTESVLSVVIILETGKYRFNRDPASIIHEPHCATGALVGCDCRPHVILYDVDGIFLLREGEDAQRIKTD